MRIVVVNKFYYNRGGDCTATIATERILKEHGHEVAVFAMDYPDNFDSPWRKYFPPEVDFGGGVKDKLRAARRLFAPRDVSKAFSRLLDDFRPDIVHLNNIHSYISPVVAGIAHDHGIKVVWTMHDYKLVCPAYLCLRDGRECTECVTNPVGVLRHRCMKGSLVQSISAWLEAAYWNKHRLASMTDCFVAPSEFVRRMMLRAGFDAAQVVTIPHCVPRKSSEVYGDDDRSDYYCYVGRLSQEKGVETLVKVAKSMEHRLVIVGDGPLRGKIEKMVAGSPHIELVGYKGWDELAVIMGRARFIVMPSEWYEVFGLVNIEAEMLGTPVLGANIGGIPDTLADRRCGMLFESGDVDDLAMKVESMFSNRFDYEYIAAKARAKFSEGIYYDNLMGLYDRLLRVPDNVQDKQ